MIEIKTKSDYDLTKNWYRKKEFLDELWEGHETTNFGITTFAK
ncbi:hypothetical protein MGAS2111_2196 [Streptococcus pyogenes MGAS2111]|nr:hypothetical protein MGAS2111_2196 [Streptococcus pyogenes MGAS2111]